MKRIEAQALAAYLGGREALDPATLRDASLIVQDVARGGEPVLRSYAEKFHEVSSGAPLVLGPEAMHQGLVRVGADVEALLRRTAKRIEQFAVAQRDSVREFSLPVPGGVAGQQVAPVERAGCYAPGGRFPLPSSVLMTAVTARAAGVKSVWVASPRPTDVTLAAAAISGAEAVLACGGAHAIAALAYGVGPVPQCDVVVGPGNRWVTAAKQIVSGRVGIDMLAGPSELTVLADESAQPNVVAADLLAQAEHDPDAVPVLVTTDPQMADSVCAEVELQLSTLPTAATARKSWQDNGLVVLASSMDEAISACNQLAPEHLELHVENASSWVPRLRHFGGLFVGGLAAEVVGDYGAGPNHTLPTGGTARRAGGLSVFHFLRIRTWIELNDPQSARPLLEDAVQLARLEGLEGHARAAEARLRG